MYLLNIRYFELYFKTITVKKIEKNHLFQILYTIKFIFSKKEINFAIVIPRIMKK